MKKSLLCLTSVLALFSSAWSQDAVSSPAPAKPKLRPAAQEGELWSIPTSQLAGKVKFSNVEFAKGGDTPLHGTIAEPLQTPTPLMPAVIWIHGGGWEHGTSKSNSFAFLALHGYFTMSIDYRLTDVAKWPAQIQDCRTAVRWLRANAAKYHVDPNRIAVGGGSAGAHLANMLGVLDDTHKEFDGPDNPGVSNQVAAVVSLYGPTDLTGKGYLTGSLSKLIGQSLEQAPDLYKAASPITYVHKGAPPVLLMQGDHDKVVAVSMGQAYADALKAAGVEEQLVIVKGTEHGFRGLGHNSTPEKDGMTGEELRAIIIAFLDKHLK